MSNHTGEKWHNLCWELFWLAMLHGIIMRADSDFSPFDTAHSNGAETFIFVFNEKRSWHFLSHLAPTCSATFFRETLLVSAFKYQQTWELFSVAAIFPQRRVQSQKCNAVKAYNIVFKNRKYNNNIYNLQLHRVHVRLHPLLAGSIVGLTKGMLVNVKTLPSNPVALQVGHLFSRCCDICIFLASKNQIDLI